MVSPAVSVYLFQASLCSFSMYPLCPLPRHTQSHTPSLFSCCQKWTVCVSGCRVHRSCCQKRTVCVSGCRVHRSCCQKRTVCVSGCRVHKSCCQKRIVCVSGCRVHRSSLQKCRGCLILVAATVTQQRQGKVFVSGRQPAVTPQLTEPSAINGTYTMIIPKQQQSHPN